MLFSEISGPLSNGSTRPLYGGAIGYSYGGGLGDSGGVSQLQQSLIAYAQTSGDASANPGPADGVLNTWTILATINTVWKAAGKVPVLGTIKNDLIGNIPGLGSLVGTLLGNPTVTLIAWAGAQAAKPSVTNAIKTWIDSHAGQLASGISLAAGLGVGPPPPLAPGGVTYPTAMTIITGVKGNAGVAANNAARPLPAGSIQTFDKKILRYRVAVPRGLGALGEVTHVERVDLATTAPRADAVIVANSDFAAKAGASDLLPWYRTVLGMVGIGVGVVAVGTGTYFLLK
jgi:hypothetical protein